MSCDEELLPTMSSNAEGDQNEGANLNGTEGSSQSDGHHDVSNEAAAASAADSEDSAEEEKRKRPASKLLDSRPRPKRITRLVRKAIRKHTPDPHFKAVEPRPQTLEGLHKEMLEEIKNSGAKLANMFSDFEQQQADLLATQNDFLETERKRLESLEEQMCFDKNVAPHLPDTSTPKSSEQPDVKPPKAKKKRKSRAKNPGANLPRPKGFADYLEEKDDLEFFRILRVTKGTYNYLFNEISSKYAPIYRGGRAPIESKMALKMSLWYLGNKGTFKEMAELFGISESGVFKAVHIVVDIICGLSVQYIKWPSGNRLAEVENSFRSMCGFPGVIGALDGTHVKIRAPKYIKADFVDRTNQHSVNLMAVCDTDKRFTFIEAGFPGSANDSTVLKNTKLYNLMWNSPRDLFPTDNVHVVGDSAFELSKYVLVPYVDYGNLIETQKRFNQRLAITRSVIGNAYSFLRARFKRLNYIDADLNRIPKVIVACCVIHNITLDNHCEEQLLLMEGGVVPIIDEADQCQPNPNLLDMEGSAKRDFVSTFLA